MSRFDMRKLYMSMNRDEHMLFRTMVRENFENKCRLGEETVSHIILDDDSCQWPYHFDPSMDILFGKHGPPMQIWHG